MTNRSDRFGRIHLLAGLCTLALACGDDDTSNTVACGEGTVQKGTECVPEDEPSSQPDSGTRASSMSPEATPMLRR